MIERVSTLFRGHPSLISGFNTFLPPGYRIECSVDEHARNVIKVTTPSGTTSTTDGEPLNLSATTPMIAESAATQYYAPYSRQQHPGPYTTGRMEPGGLGISQHTVPVQPMMMYGQHHASTVSQDDHGSSSRRAPVEFNHAINYVNKIKVNFASTMTGRLLTLFKRIGSLANPIPTNNFLKYCKHIKKNRNQFKKFMRKSRCCLMVHRTYWMNSSSSYRKQRERVNRRVWPRYLIAQVCLTLVIVSWSSFQ